MRPTPKKIENFELFSKNINSKLRSYEIFEICSVKGQNGLFRGDRISPTKCLIYYKMEAVKVTIRKS